MTAPAGESGSPERVDAPLRVAHRAGNNLARLVAAEAASVDLIELDLWLYRGRLEVRHSKTMGPIPLLWDRWSLQPGWTRRFELADVLADARRGTGLLLDLKGHAPDLPRRAIEQLERARPGVPYAVSSQNWELLPPFRALPHVRVVYSAGNPQALATALALARSEGLPGIGVQQRILAPDQVSALREQVPTLITWTVNDLPRARELLDWGVSGIISDRLDVLRALAPPQG